MRSGEVGGVAGVGQALPREEIVNRRGEVPALVTPMVYGLL